MRAGRRRSLAALVVAAGIAVALGGVPSGPADAALPLDAVGGPLEAGFHTRSENTGISIGPDGNVYVWGATGDGRSGTDAPQPAGPEGAWPTPVAGLPEGGMVEVTASGNAYNAIDLNGKVWGWGTDPGYRPPSGTGLGAPVYDGTVTPRDGSTCAVSAPPALVQARESPWVPGAPLTGAVSLTSTAGATAAVTADGTVWVWGDPAYGGAQPVLGCPGGGAYRVHLPDPAADPGNVPVSVRGGFATFWVVLANGDIYFWGDPARDGGSRPVGEVGGIVTYDAPQRSVLSDTWSRAASPSRYIVAVDSAARMAGAVLSDGSLLTWAQSTGGVAGRLGASASGSQTPGIVPGIEGVVHLFYGTSDALLVTDDGTLYGFGQYPDSRQCLPSWPGQAIPGTACAGRVSTQVPAVLDTDVVAFHNGAAFAYWKKRVPDAAQPGGVGYEYRGIGQNASSQLGQGAAPGTVLDPSPVEFRTGDGACDPVATPRCSLLHVIDVPGVPVG